jgi:hypothetical protein
VRQAICKAMLHHVTCPPRGASGTRLNGLHHEST